MIFNSIRDFRAKTKAAFDSATDNPVYVNRHGDIYMIRYLAPASDVDIALDPASGDEVLIMKKETSYAEDQAKRRDALRKAE